MSFIDQIFNPLLNLPVLWIVILLSLLASLIVTLVYKYATDQTLMKKLKDELKSFQQQIRTESSNPAKAMEINKKAMQTNLQYMQHSMKANLLTFIPLIFLFSWMSAHLAFAPISPNTEFAVTAIFTPEAIGKVEIAPPDGIIVKDEKVKEISAGSSAWRLEGRAGEYLLEFKFNNEVHTKEVIIDGKNLYAVPDKKIKNSQLKQIVINNKPIKLLNLFGWKIGWLGSYIIFSLIFSMLLRKVMKVY